LAYSSLINQISTQMKSLLIAFGFLIFNLAHAQNQQLDSYKKTNINKIITAFKQQDFNKISKLISYPLRREYPIPSIKNEKEFKLRFKQVFDDSLVKIISHSKMKQWNEVGWRGIMLNNGTLWIDSYDGKITAVNYQSEFEKKWLKQLIEKQRQSLHASLKTFVRPVYKIVTKNYLIRIDETIDDHYRYASWKIGNAESSKPDLVLENGELEMMGSGGNLVIKFKSNNFTYLVYRNLIGADNTPDITLEVQKDGNTILTEDGTLTGM